MEGNDVCVDCPKKHPTWASVSNGVLLCLECAGVHRGLGVDVSFVRSLTLDAWTDKQLRTMRAGGNSALQSAFASAGMPEAVLRPDTAPDGLKAAIAKKYRSNVAEAYRARLVALRDVNAESLMTSGDSLSKLPSYKENAPKAAGRSAEEEAKQRMAAKFGKGGLSGMGSCGASAATDGDNNTGGDGGVRYVMAGVALVFVAAALKQLLV